MERDFSSNIKFLALRILSSFLPYFNYKINLQRAEIIFTYELEIILTQLYIFPVHRNEYEDTLSQRLSATETKMKILGEGGDLLAVC